MIKVNQDLPLVNANRTLKQEVDRLIRNKIEPLAYKHYLLKSGQYASTFKQSDRSINHCNLTAVLPKPNYPSLPRCKTKHEGKQNSKAKMLKIDDKRRRKAVIQIGFGLDFLDYKELQSKVENHIMLKKISLMENNFTNAEECNKKQKIQMYKKLWTSPLEKYLDLFQNAEKISEKIQRIKESSCQKILRQIKSAKSIKNLEAMEDNMKGLWNNENKLEPKAKRNKNFDEKNLKDMTCISSRQNRINEKKLRREIISDIKKDCQAQGSSKIRISINHRKMIQII